MFVAVANDCSIENLLDDVSMLISPPELVISLHQAMGSPTSSAKTLAVIVAQDPNLSARVLRIANSSLYGLCHRVDTIPRAITVIGTRGLYHLCMAVVSAQSFAKLPSDLIDINVFWRHSIFTALIARALAKRCRILHPERLFVAGLLHDIGTLVLYTRFADTLEETFEQSQGREDRMAKDEQRLFGYNHAQVGGELLKRWGLPKQLCHAISMHHCNNREKAFIIEDTILYLADCLSNRSELGSFSKFGAYEHKANAAVWDALRLDEAITESLWDEAKMQFVDTMEIIFPAGTS